MKKLAKFKQKKTHNPKANFESWDWGYYVGRYDEDVLQLDENALSEYFPAEHIKQKTMDIYQELLGLKFKKMEGAKTWHKDVSQYEVKDKESQ